MIRMEYEFVSLMKGRESPLDPEIKARSPSSPLENRMRVVLGSRGLDPQLAGPLAEKMISTGVYTFPMYYSEFSETRQQLFRTLARLHREASLNGRESSKKRFALLSVVGSAMGLLSEREIKATTGGEGEPEHYLLHENYVDFYHNTLTSSKRGGPIKLNRLSQAVRLAQSYRGLGLVTCLYFGTFDKIHIGHQKTAFWAKKLFGEGTIIMAGIVGDRESLILKGREPQRDLDTRLENMQLTKGVDVAFPIIAPGWVQTKDQLVGYYMDLHLNLSAQLRISGPSENIGQENLAIYLEQCRQANTLLLINDRFTETSTSKELKLEQH